MSEKQRVYLLVSLSFAIILFIILFIKYENSKSTYDRISEYVNVGLVLQKDTQQDFKLKDIDISFIRDSFNDVHVLFFSKHRVIHYVYFKSKEMEGQRVYWKAGRYEQMQLFAGVIYDERINQLSINGITDNQLLKVDYDRRSYYLSITPESQTEPIMIKGYSKNNELIYSNE